MLSRRITVAGAGVYCGMTPAKTQTQTPPVDAPELVVILFTLAGCAALFGALVVYESNRVAATFGVWAPALFVIGAVFAVGAVVIRALGSKV